MRVAGRLGSIDTLLGHVSRVTGLLRDRVTGEMHAVTTRGLREVEEALARIPARGDGRALDVVFQAMSRVLAFTAALSGLAAENMVRGGGRLFLDLGRRVERAQGVADQMACALEFPGAAHQPARVEHGLRLALELCDSSITYRSRYLAVVQPAPALDLLLADDGNPRGLAFQLDAMRALLSEIGGAADTALAVAAAALQEEPQAMVSTVSEATDQSAAALLLPARLRSMHDAVADLSDRVSRHHSRCYRPLEWWASRRRPDRCVGTHVLPRATPDAVPHRTPVDLGAHLAHLRPRSLPHQQVLRAGIDAVPAVSWRRDGNDHFGNEVTWLFLDEAHAAFQVIADATVDVAFPEPPHRVATPSWRETVARQAWDAGGDPVRSPSSCSTARTPRLMPTQVPMGNAASCRGVQCWRRCSISMSASAGTLPFARV